MARRLGLYLAPVLVVLVVTPAQAVAAPARGSAPGACTTWVHTASPNPGTGDNNLYGVTATSPRDAWAVGEYFVGVDTKTLIEHWNGTAWRTVPSPNRGTGDLLQAVYAVSADNAWAVGNFYNGTAGRTLIEHWNGKSWSVVPSPNTGAGSNELTAVRGTSASDIWAAGDAVTSYPVSKTVLVHWNGQHWRIASSPSKPAEPNLLTGVRPVSATGAWAVGRYVNGSFTSRTLILHWTNGHWRIVPSPNVGTNANVLFGVRASSSADAWAAGEFYNGKVDKTLILHWDGHHWGISPSPNVGKGSNDLHAIAGTSASNGYAAGQVITGSTSKVLILHWNGTRWRVMPGANPGRAGNTIAALYALSPASVWAVGSFASGLHNRTLIERCQ